MNWRAVIGALALLAAVPGRGDELAQNAREAMRAAMLERAPLPSGPASLPDRMAPAMPPTQLARTRAEADRAARALALRDALHVGGLLLVLAVTSSPAEKSAGEHLGAGAQAFREGRYQEALVEFRVAQGLGASDAGPYAAATLVKLGRAEEAVEAFASTEEGRDALLDYYRGIACYEARLYLCADRLLAGVGARSGPRIAAEAAKARAAIASELAREPPRPTIDWYVARCGERRDAGRPRLAAAFCEEAVGLAERRADRYRIAEAASQLSSLSVRRTGARR